MINDYYKDMYSTLQQPEEFRSSNAITFNDCMNINEDFNNNDINDHKLLSSLCPISNINTEEYLSMNNMMQSCNNSNEILFTPQEWLVNDSFSGKIRAPRQNEFLLLILKNPKYSSYISWLEKDEGLFKIHEPEQLAKLWTKVKNRQTTRTMDYETFARGIRFYYKSGSMIKTYKKHTFRFKLPINNTS
jgi:hypothetical protein